jgi:hypothetical protein
LALTLTPADEIATMHPSDLRQRGAQGLSLVELRAVVASLPNSFEGLDTAAGEKRTWADGFAEALKAINQAPLATSTKPFDTRRGKQVTPPPQVAAQASDAQAVK